MTYTEAQKRANKKWIIKNREKSNEYHKVYNAYYDNKDYLKSYYLRNKDEIIKKSCARQRFNTEWKRLCNILIEN